MIFDEILMNSCAMVSPCTPLIGFRLWSVTLATIIFAASYIAVFVMLVMIGRRRRYVAIASGYRIVLLFVVSGAVAPIVYLFNFQTDDLVLMGIGQLVPAIITAVTAIKLWQMLPAMLDRPSPSDLHETNEALRREMVERHDADAALLQSRKMEAIGRVAGGLAHNYNNMLQVISGNVAIIAQKSADDPAIAPLAAAVQASVDHGVRLTAKLLSLSQEQSFLLEPIRIGAFAASLPDRIALPPTITLEIEGGDVEGSVLADRTQLELAILNVVTNSQDAMPDGGHLHLGFSKIHVRESGELADGDYLRIVITDTGVGMAPSDVDRAFDPFFSTRPAGMAHGLGLSIVHAIAQRSGGTATIASRVGEGTTVTIYLRLASSDNEAPEEPASAARESFSGRRIMLVDDEAATRSVVALTLESLDCQVVTADSGAQALALADESWPDLFLLDYAMPTMTGAELARQLRARSPSGCIMFLTGFADFSDIRATVGDDVIILQKPVSRRALAHALSRAFDEKPVRV
jgi:signal transduction histidine kinase/ActR/RegA family two-component response regulator